MKYIESNQIKQRSIQQLECVDQYDMYMVEFEFFNGETKKIKVFTEKNTFPLIGSDEWNYLKENRYKDIYTFFIDRLIGKNSLLKKQKRDDYIYLGGFFEKEDKENRHIRKDKKGQRKFESNLFELKLKIETREKMENDMQNFTNKEKGKHYVISDIHGMLGSYEKAMKNLNKEDEIFILGDVIDRGDNGIKILQDIIRKKENPQNNPKINFILGNHEWQFLSVLKNIKEKNLTEEDCVIMYLWRNISDFLKKAGPDTKKSDIEKYTEKFNVIDERYREIQKNKNITNANRDYLYRWVGINKGFQTIIDYFELPEKERNDMYEFLYNSNVVMAEQIKDQDYLFVHAVPPNDRNMLKTMKKDKRYFKYSELPWFDLMYMIETRRDNSSYSLAKQEGYITICGHDPSLGKIVSNDEYNYIRVDAGCGHGKVNDAKLAVYCIEDDSVKYIDEIQTIEECR